MEETETAAPHPDYIKGFNEGYIMSKHMPEVTEKFISQLTKDERGQGFQDGSHQFVREQSKDQLPSWRRADWLPKSDKSGPSKSKDGPDR